jgi:multidrug efflux pump
VTQVLEQQLKGIDGMLYFTSTSSNGSSSITVTFEKGTNPDTAQVQVQNAISRSLSRLPAVVQQLGVTVTKAQSDMLLVLALYDTSGRSTVADIADYLTTHFQDPLSRVEGVGSADVFGSSYAMRIWLDPAKLAAVNLMPSDVTAALTAQNTQVPAGEIGALPAPQGQRLDATVTARSRLQTVDDFKRSSSNPRPMAAWCICRTLRASRWVRKTTVRSTPSMAIRPPACRSAWPRAPMR